jgi:MFS family permease
MITYVAVPFQIKEMTNSYIAVGLSGVVEIVPLILFGLYGGVLADYVDRKKMVWATEFASLVLVAILLASIVAVVCCVGIFSRFKIYNGYQ